MSSPSTSLLDALALSLEAVERACAEVTPGLTFGGPEIGEFGGGVHRFNVSGAALGMMGLAIEPDGPYAAMLAEAIDKIAAEVRTDLGAALARDLAILVEPGLAGPVDDVDTAVFTTITGKEGSATLWLVVDERLAETLGSAVEARLAEVEAHAQANGDEPIEVVPAEFPQVGPPSEDDILYTGPRLEEAVGGLSLLSDVLLSVTVELGRTSMRLRDVLELGAGSVVELDRSAGTPVDLLVNGTIVARGEVVVVDDELGVRVTEVVNQSDTGPAQRR